jgi:hypothetical protein
VPACDDAHQPGASHQGAAHPSPAGRLRTLRQDLQELLQHEGTPAHRARRLSEASLRCTKIRNICQFVCDDVLICRVRYFSRSNNTGFPRFAQNSEVYKEACGTNRVNTL